MKTTKSFHTLQPYEIPLRIYFTDDPIKLIKKLIIENPDPCFRFKEDWLEEHGAAASTNAGMAGKDMSEYTIFCVFDTDNNEMLPTITHESVHVLSNILLFTGAQYDPKNDEPMAYMAGHVFNLIEKAYSRVK